jgi:hypothetical protein
MAQTYLLPKAYCIETGQSVKIQDLTGARYTLGQRSFAQQQAETLAQSMSQRTRKTWAPYLVEYTPTERRS